MTWLVPGIIALLLVLIALLPLAVKCRYDALGFRAGLQIGPVSILLYPRPKKETKGPEKAKRKKDTPKKEDTGGEAEKGGNTQLLKLLLQQLPEFLSDLRCKLRIRNIRLHYMMAGGDPADMAMNYGKAWTAIGNLWPYLERFFVIKKRDISVSCDFTQSQSTVFAQLDISITVGRTVALACKHGWRLLKNSLKQTKNNEGGAKQ